MPNLIVFNRLSCAITLAAALLLSAGGARAQLRWEPLNAGYYEIPPYLESVDGKLAGVLYETWNDLSKRVGVSYKPISLPPARLVKGLADGDVDVSLTPINFPEFAGRTLHSERPVEHIVLEAYNFWPAPTIGSIKELVGKSVVVQQGFGYGGLIAFLRAPENRITIAASVPKAENGLAMLEAGRADYLLHYRPAIERLRERIDFHGLQATVLNAVPIHVVLSTSVPNAAALMARFDAAILARQQGR